MMAVNGEQLNQADLNRLAGRLVERCSTMVLATGGNDGPWAAPVYYVWHTGAFWFYSAADSRHVRQGLNRGKAAAALWEDADYWRKIQGLQMKGHLERVRDLKTAAAIAIAYVSKFSRAAAIVKEQITGPTSSGSQVGLYAFRPAMAIYTNNSFGLGFHSPVQLECQQQNDPGLF